MAARSADRYFELPPGEHSISVVTAFDPSDPPDDVCGLLAGVAGTLPHLRPGASPSTVAAGAGQYSTSIPVRSPADGGDCGPARNGDCRARCSAKGSRGTVRSAAEDRQARREGCARLRCEHTVHQLFR